MCHKHSPLIFELVCMCNAYILLYIITFASEILIICYFLCQLVLIYDSGNF